ncbi:MAG: polysaccharide deacetylase family protein [Dehalococcoidia bacterium]|nr:polysaccharide deacetylase family protein [Dehalococcoidia bacterium]
MPARQAGAYAARGEIIVQADADTIYPPDWLSRIINNFHTHPRAVAVAGRYVYSDPPRWAFLEYALRILSNFISMLFARRLIFVSGSNFAFRRDAFLRVGGYKTDTFSPDQLGLANRLSKFGSIIYDYLLVVSTSSRRVQKPFFVVLSEGLNISTRAVGHFLMFLWDRLGLTFSRRPAWLKPLATSVPLVMVISFVSYGYFVPGSQVFGHVYYQDKSQKYTIALTFDDGPNEPYTSQVLDILDRYDVKATFFLIGMNVERYPEVARRILASGHVIGNHSYSHDANHALHPYPISDIRKGQHSIYNATGVIPHLYRPPHGKKTPWELKQIREENLVEVTWSISANEAMIKSPQALAKAITDRERDGRIILLHDGYGTEHGTKNADKSLTVAALPLIIEKLQQDGYRFVTVPQLFNIRPYNN